MTMTMLARFKSTTLCGKKSSGLGLLKCVLGPLSVALLFLNTTALHKVEGERLVVVIESIKRTYESIETIGQAIQECHRHFLIVNRDPHRLLSWLVEFTSSVGLALI